MTSPLAVHPLWRFVVEHTTDEDLQVICRADYGMELDIHLRELRRLCRSPDPDFTLEWNPLEVLVLTRWKKTPDDRDSAAGVAMERQRLFATTALLVSLGEPKNDGHLAGRLPDDLIIAWEALLHLHPQQIGHWFTFLDLLELHALRNINDDDHFVDLMRTIVAADPAINFPEIACTSADRAWRRATAAQRRDRKHRQNTKPWGVILATPWRSTRKAIWRSHLDRTLDNAHRGGHTALTHELLQLRGGIAP